MEKSNYFIYNNTEDEDGSQDVTMADKNGGERKGKIPKLDLSKRKGFLKSNIETKKEEKKTLKEKTISMKKEKTMMEKMEAMMMKMDDKMDEDKNSNSALMEVLNKL